MKFKTDENLPVEVVDLLRQAGHDALSVMDQQLAGHPDGDVAAVCQAEQRALVTLDLDFSDIRPIRPKTTRASSCCVLCNRRSHRFCDWRPEQFRCSIPSRWLGGCGSLMNTKSAFEATTRPHHLDERDCFQWLAS